MGMTERISRLVRFSLTMGLPSLLAPILTHYVSSYLDPDYHLTLTPTHNYQTTYCKGARPSLHGQVAGILLGLFVLIRQGGLQLPYTLAHRCPKNTARELAPDKAEGHTTPMVRERSPSQQITSEHVYKNKSVDIYSLFNNPMIY